MLRILFLYHANDKTLYSELIKFLATALHSNNIGFHDLDEIIPGEIVEEKLAKFYDESLIIVLLISSNSINQFATAGSDRNSSYLSINQIIEDEKILIPVLARGCLWETTELSRFKMLQYKNQSSRD